MSDTPTTLFPITPETLLEQARPHPCEDASDVDARWRERLAELCGLYYEPVLQWFTRVGVPGDPKDAAHDFLHRWLTGNPLAGYERGDRRFRHFLKASLRHFHIDLIRRTSRARRGGGVEHVDVSQVDPPSDLSEASDLVDRLIARSIAIRVLRSISRNGLAENPAQRIEMIRRVLDRQQMSDSELSSVLGISVNALCLRVSRLRQQFWSGYSSEVQRMCRGRVAAEEEFSALLQVMQQDASLIDCLEESLRMDPTC